MLDLGEGMLPYAIALVTCVFFAIWALRRISCRRRRVRKCTEPLQGEQASWQGSYQDPLRFAYLPEGGECLANSEHAYTSENDLCTIKLLAMHRPTHEPWREESGSFPFAWHMSGRKRLWEIRLQLRFKETPTEKIYFGLFLSGFVPLSAIARRVQAALVQVCSRIVGDFYHTPGDDPARTKGEVEPPTFVMPMWAFDQFIVSEPGEEPLLWSDLEGLGMRRTDGLGAYVKALRSTVETFSTDKVYTFCFWGVSQFLDCMRWDICGGVLPGFRLDFNRLCGAPPVHVAMYKLQGVEEGSTDVRHLPSRKRFYFNVAMWSQARPPKPEVLESLLGKREDEDAKAALKPRQRAPGLFACCVSRPQEAKGSKKWDDASWLGG